MNIDITVLTRVINQWDPVGLLSGGAPENEYSIEIREIAEGSSSCHSEADLARLIYKVFNDKMGVNLNHLDCLKHAFIITDSKK